MSRGGKSFKIIDRKSLYSLEKIVGRNLDFQGDFGQGPERVRRAVENICIETIYIAVSRRMLEIGTLMVLLGRAQK